MKKEKIIKIIITILIIIIIIIGLLKIGNVEIQDGKITTNKKKNNEIKTTVDKGILKDAKIKNLDINDISISYVQEAGTTFKFTLSNNTEEVVDLKSLDIHFKDKDGNTIVVLSATTGGSIKPNQKNIIRLTHPEDLTKAVSIEYQEGN